jgi:hypothetical protein
MWVISPGEKARDWPEFRKGSFIAVLLLRKDLGDLRKYKDAQAIADALRREYPEEFKAAPRYLPKYAYDFVHEMSVDDYVFARRGRRRVLAVGRIKSLYEYDPKSEDVHFRHRRRVQWFADAPFDLPRDLEFEDYALSEVTRDSPLWAELQPHLPAFSPPPTPRVISDQWVTEDSLGYEAYARALANLITHPETVPPLTIGIEAPWGAGKTSVMKMVQHILDGQASLLCCNVRHAISLDMRASGAEPDLPTDEAITRFVVFSVQWPQGTILLRQAVGHGEGIDTTPERNRSLLACLEQCAQQMLSPEQNKSRSKAAHDGRAPRDDDKLWAELLKKHGIIAGPWANSARFRQFLSTGVALSQQANKGLW